MLIQITTSSPPYSVPQSTAAEELKNRMATRPAVARLIDAAAQNSGIDTRSVVVPDGEGDPGRRFYPATPTAPQPDTAVRMREYERWSRELTLEASRRLLRESGCDPGSVRRLITISCTGFFAPGIDYHLMRELGLPPSTRRTQIGFMGCAAALVGVASALEGLRAGGANGGTTLLVAVELCSLHLQTEPTRDNILANMIFADGCAAALFSRDPALTPRLDLLFTASHLFPDSSTSMGWRIGNTGFEMTLSSELPRMIEQEAAPVLRRMLREEGIEPSSIRHWALHPGGRAILDALQSGLGLEDREVAPSRAVLRRHGNMSSPSILFVLKELLDTRRIEPGEHVCAVAFGPGLTMEVAMMRGV